MGETPMGNAYLLMRLHLHIKELAEARGISRTKLSRLADVNYATINSLWTDETRDVLVGTLEKIAKVLKVPVSDLYTLVDDEETP
jgi:DNA-binding Xre family transcriptional regulator